MGFFDFLFGRKLPAPRQLPPPRSAARRQHYPATFGPRPALDEPGESLIFDPALRQYRRAYRRGDPVLPAAEMLAWQQARRRFIRYLIEIFTQSPWADQLVLRGSLALVASLGVEAREPGDMDWVIRPAALKMDSPEANELLEGLLLEVARNAFSSDIHMDINAITRDDIWTYERAPGHRIVFPWRVDQLPSGVVQMDFVFEQVLHTEPSQIPLQLGDLPPVMVTAASEEESLAWKLVWLHTDGYPQGKDLYDATLLAERINLSASLMRTALQDAQAWNPSRITEAFPFHPQEFRGTLEETLEWDNFLKECPWVNGLQERWIARLSHALAPMVKALRELKQPC
jgi:hypothetical protein